MDKDKLIRNNPPPPYESTAYSQPQNAPLIHPSCPPAHLAGYQGQPAPQPHFPQGYAPQGIPPYGPQGQPPFLADRKIIHGGIWCLAVTAICCCSILGIVALVYTISGNDRERRQDYPEAMRNARLAKIFGCLGIIIGIILNILVITSAIVGAALSGN